MTLPKNEAAEHIKAEKDVFCCLFYDKKWKKGFKLRVYLDQYEKFGAFAFVSKALSVKENQTLECGRNVAIPCDERDIKMPTIACVHKDENSELLPDEIRGGHYLHNRHVCAVLNCEHAPYGEVKKLLSKAEYCINPFPVLVKGTIEQIKEIVSADPIMKKRSYEKMDINISDLYEQSEENEYIFSDDNEAGYPLNKVILAVTFLIAAQTGQLNGLRPKGSKDKMILEYIKRFSGCTVTIYLPEIMTPMILEMGDYAALVGPNNPKVYRRLIQTCRENKYKIKVRPITEEDLK